MDQTFDPKLWWYLARSTGLVAWGLAVASILLGLALATRALGKRVKAPWMLGLHRWTGSLTVLFTLAHVGALIGDSWVHFGAADVLVPFASTWRPAPVAAGVVAMWLLVAVQLSSVLMRRLPKRFWHGIHLTSYVAAVLATVHGLTAGTDTRGSTFAWATVAVTALMCFFAAYRRLAPAKRSGRDRVPRPATAEAATT